MSLERLHRGEKVLLMMNDKLLMMKFVISNYFSELWLLRSYLFGLGTELSLGERGNGGVA